MTKKREIPMDDIDAAALIDDRPRDGVFRVHRAAFSDAQVFAREMRRVFERCWVFVAHASQVRAPHDYLTTNIGRHEVVVMRDGAGQLRCFINSCRHKGATVCHAPRGNARVHVCRYHGWSYGSDGRNVAIKSRVQGEYTEAFDRDSHDLAPVARFGEYRGFLFANLDPEAVPLDRYLGDARAFIDLIVDASEHGVELVPGNVSYTYEANWKLQL
jgi:benzoate/toluate 1,2-dioxygenase alpha subunit